MSYGDVEPSFPRPPFIPEGHGIRAIQGPGSRLRIV